jgi:hypothetical protein
MTAEPWPVTPTTQGGNPMHENHRNLWLVICILAAATLLNSAHLLLIEVR